MVQLVEGAVGKVAGQQVLRQPAAPLQHQPLLHEVRRGKHGRGYQDDGRVLPQRAVEAAWSHTAGLTPSLPSEPMPG